MPTNCARRNIFSTMLHIRDSLFQRAPFFIIRNNNDESQKEEIETKEEVLEFMTKYKTNKDLPKGTIQVLQEGREGLQQISLKKTYKYGELVNEEQIGAKITKASIDKIVEIGDANYSSNYQVKVRRHCLCNC